MTPFSDIYDRAAARHGGKAALEKKIAEYIFLKSPQEIADLPDDRYLSQMTKCIFQSGFNWKVIENKWAGFEEAFQNFDTAACAFLADDAIDDLAKDTRIIRNRAKIATVPANARMIQKVSEASGSFGKFLADWPADDQLGLMEYLTANGSRLGGLTGQYFIRFSGWDSFVFSKDGSQALLEAGVVDKTPVTSKGDVKKAQAAFTAWHKESGRPYAEVSRVLALSTDAP